MVVCNRIKLEGGERMNYLRIASFVLAILGIVFSMVNLKERY